MISKSIIASAARPVLSFEQVQELLHLTAFKDRRTAGLVGYLSLLNVAAIVAIATLLHFGVPEDDLDVFRSFGQEALAAFLAGAVIASLTFGTRRSAVVVRLKGMRARFHVTRAIIFAVLVSVAGFVAGSSRLFSGMASVG